MTLECETKADIDTQVLMGTDHEKKNPSIESDNEVNENESSSSEDSEDEEDEILLVIELPDFKNHPIFPEHQRIEIKDIESSTPQLRIGEYILHGELEETIGTQYIYDKTQEEYEFIGQTTKKMKFTIAPPDPEE